MISINDIYIDFYFYFYIYFNNLIKNKGIDLLKIFIRNI